ncbi:MAG TPA: UDP-N-acetylmuramoyl-tripeptide--D-alanyl-D-alanine ligase [Campylobacterales bacterium]|nr:UDP-N-acetylmuramoyl-tripeptide--D-alanyl-D-alanine ligase [Campylobacterales bacterium]
MENFKIFELFSHFALVMILGWYLITNLQWYSYKLERVIFKHKRYSWHILYFILPIFAYYLSGKYFWIYFYLGLLPALFMWSKRIDKKLVFTARVKRFFLFLAVATLFGDVLCLVSQKCHVYGLLLPIGVALGASFLFEKMLFNDFKKKAQKKLTSMDSLEIVAITASYGKTSIKNFLHQIVSPYIDAYMTPRSVNTLGGLVKDINDDLPSSTKLYIAEAGARLKGDIDDIAKLLNHDYAIVGSIGEQHIEYFKTLENIRNTKMEILNSKKLKKAFVHKSAHVKAEAHVVIFGDNIQNILATLDGLAFDLEIEGKIHHFESPLLGAFNATNLTAAILIAYELGVKIENIQKQIKKLKQVDHRLQKIEAGGKLIIDDSFNGNLEGMVSSYELMDSYNGKKVIVTPGVIESDCDTNIKLAEKIDEVFDTVIITGKVNANVLYENIHKAKKILLTDKDKLEETLAQETTVGDLVLFSNDAPTFM